MEIYPAVHQLTTSFVNYYLVIGAGRTLLIDSGLRGSARKTLAQVEALCPPGQTLSDVVITHADGDHYGGLAGLQAAQAFTAQAFTAWAHPIEAAAVQSARSSRALHPRGVARLLYRLVAPLFKSDPARIDRSLNGGEELPFLGGLAVIATPGHTPGHLSLFAPAAGILFAGDSIQVRKHGPIPSSGANTWDEALAAASFERQMALDPALILAGHGVWRKGDK